MSENKKHEIRLPDYVRLNVNKWLKTIKDIVKIAESASHNVVKAQVVKFAGERANRAVGATLADEYQQACEAFNFKDK